jgi:membrane fusion protein (multidrug efflux system)
VAESTPAPGAEPEEKAAAATKGGRTGYRGPRRFLLIVIGALVLIGAGIVYWRSTLTEDTDDAQINGHLIQISSRIAGTVAKVNVDENQFVAKGTVIAELDPRDYQVARDNAAAALANAKAGLEAAQVNVPITAASTGSTLRSAEADVSGSQAGIVQAQRQLEASHARVAEARANNTKAQADLERYRPLVAKDVISKQQFDAATAAADAAKAGLADALASEQASEQSVKVASDRETQAQAGVKSAQTAPQQVAAQNARAQQAAAVVAAAEAQLEQADLNLSYTKIVAPSDGIITRKSLELNQNISTGQNLLTLVSLENLWVTANFKETQLKKIHSGQAVEIAVDATGHKYRGKVTEVGGATGSVLSLFPPDNATGNYVKVVQRVPVRIDFTDLANEDKEHQLRPGLSVEPVVDIK